MRTNINTTAVASSSSGVGFAGLLTIAFIVLKLCKVITWSWWWVLSPLWISFALLIGIIFIIVFIAILVAVFGK